MNSLIDIAFNQNTLAGLIILLLSTSVAYFIRSFVLKSKANDERHDKEISDLKELINGKNNELRELLNSQAVKVHRHAEVLDKNHLANVSDQIKELCKEMNGKIVDIELEIGKDIVSLKSKYNELDKMSENDRLSMSRIYSSVDRIKDQVDNSNGIIQQVLEQKIKLVEETSKSTVEINQKITSFVVDYEGKLALLSNEKDCVRISQNQYEKELIQLKQDFDKTMTKYTEELTRSIKASNNSEQFKIILGKITPIVRILTDVSHKTAANSVKISDLDDRMCDIDLTSKKNELAMSEIKHYLNNEIHKNRLETSRIRLHLERGVEKTRKE